MKISFSTVVEYVKNLLPLNCVPISDNPQEDAVALASLLYTDAFYTNANNGKMYLYCFPQYEEDYKLVRYILHSNSMTPRKHKSNYYYGTKVVLRVPGKEIEVNERARHFVEILLETKRFKLNKELAAARVALLREKMMGYSK